MTKRNFLIYGSYGYTGNLIAELACKENLKPVLGGRNQEKLKAQATRLNLDYRVFDVGDLAATKHALDEFIAVIHCAGPFTATYKNMTQGCLETKTHYLDITGEVNVIANIMDLHEQALGANIMLLPGAGFDVVPSDCLAQHLKERLPDATQLILAISALNDPTTKKLAISRGTAKSFLLGIAEATLMRDHGTLVKANTKARDFDFGDHHPITCAPISWGDLASAWWSTRIPHIETYMALPKKMILLSEWLNPFKFMFKSKLLQEMLEKKINQLPAGPTPIQQKNSSARVYGEALNPSGKRVVSILRAPEGYAFTAASAVHIVKKILAGNAPIGYQAPSSAYGKDLVLELNGVTREDVR